MLSGWCSSQTTSHSVEQVSTIAIYHHNMLGMKNCSTKLNVIKKHNISLWNALVWKHLMKGTKIALFSRWNIHHSRTYWLRWPPISLSAWLSPDQLNPSVIGSYECLSTHHLWCIRRYLIRAHLSEPFDHRMCRAFQIFSLWSQRTKSVMLQWKR